MRRFILITLAAALLFPSQMTGKGFRWGLEWGASGICHSNTYCVYTADEGFIVEYRKLSNRMHVNGTLEGFVGIDFARRMNISLHSGYAGIADGERGVPLSLRPTLRLGRKPDAGGASIFAEYSSGKMLTSQCLPSSEPAGGQHFRSIWPWISTQACRFHGHIRTYMTNIPDDI